MNINEIAFRAYEDGEIVLNGENYRVIGLTEFENEFDTQLDEWFGEVKIGGFVWDTSTALKRLDTIAYRQMQLDELDNLANDHVLVFGETLEDHIRAATSVGEGN